MPKGGFLALLINQAVNQSLADTVELGLVDEPLAGIWLGVGIVANHVDAGFQRLAQNWRDGDRVVGGEEDTVHALRDVAVDDLDLVVDIGVGRTIGGDGNVAQLLGGLLLTQGGCAEVTNADQLRYINHDDVRASHVIAHGHHAAIVVHHIHVFIHVFVIVLVHHLAAHATSERIDFEVVGTVPAVLRAKGHTDQRQQAAPESS